MLRRRKLCQDGIRDAPEKTFGFDRHVGIVKVRIVERGTVQEPADAHQNVGFAGVVVSDQSGKVAQWKRLLSNRTEIPDGN